MTRWSQGAAAPAITAVVRYHIARDDVVERLGGFAEARAAPLRRRAESGAQAAEYAMLGGVSAACCGALALILKQESVLRPLVEAVVQTLTRFARSWVLR